MSRPYLTLWFGGFLPHISTYAMCVLIDWTWLNNVCLQLIRRPHRLRFTSRSFRAERALQLLAVPVETDLAILISDFADFSALLPQVSNLNSSSSHLVSFHGCCGHWKSDSHNQENRMCHENPLHHVYIVRLIFGANDSCSVQGCRLLSQWILQVSSAGQNTQHKKSYVILQDLRLALQPLHWHVRQSLKIFSDPNTASLLSDSMVQPGSQLLGMCFQHSKQQEPCLALSLAPHMHFNFLLLFLLFFLLPFLANAVENNMKLPCTTTSLRSWTRIEAW